MTCVSAVTALHHSMVTLSHSSSLIIIVAVALFIGLIILLAGLLVIRRYAPRAGGAFTASCGIQNLYQPDIVAFRVSCDIQSLLWHSFSCISHIACCCLQEAFGFPPESPSPAAAALPPQGPAVRQQDHHPGGAPPAPRPPRPLHLLARGERVRVRGRVPLQPAGPPVAHIQARRGREAYGHAVSRLQPVRNHAACRARAPAPEV